MHNGSVYPGGTASSAASGPLPIPYTAEEVGRTFAGLLATFDFEAELRDLGIGRFSILKRRLAKRHFMAICVALWHIALEKSFPNDADSFFNHFMGTWQPVAGERGGAKKLRDLVSGYDTLIAEKKDSDFTCGADTLIAALNLREEDQRKQQLRLSLRIRGVFELIFEKLI